ncbi:hypothetical protein [Vibrio breoganii]|uniref:hypothetical protein n=1 Tax=Vibrio breoganii TaxID=553239 RepID=UPI000C859A5E|nr:hypothetical protein [Vibrio breoganii]PMF79172.1 hypothetical protein BCV08_02215 [Vibrio breoganii]PMH16631.1 hypothetical protein BCU74_01360 [Vibrio breoganii]PMM16215.1 hypothetical protein BCT60_00555 [Vibrio breoganii]TKG15794.1 hypothetical protein FCV81_16905 [Vibrio breoganii]
MKKNTYKQVCTVMAPYKKKGIPYRRKQIQRLLTILEDIFEHEPNLHDELERIGRKQIIGYWRRTEGESPTTRQEKYKVLCLFFEAANLRGHVPYPK